MANERIRRIFIYDATHTRILRRLPRNNQSASLVCPLTMNRTNDFAVKTFVG